MTLGENYMTKIQSRKRECEIRCRAYHIWLQALSPANMVLVVGAGLLSLIAGANILTHSGIITLSRAGILAVISTCLTLIHKGLNCDVHQAECKKLEALYDELRIQYGSLDVETNDVSLKKKIEDLDDKRANLAQSTTATPPDWCLRSASRDNVT